MKMLKHWKHFLMSNVISSVNAEVIFIPSYGNSTTCVTMCISEPERGFLSICTGIS